MSAEFIIIDILISSMCKPIHWQQETRQNINEFNEKKEKKTAKLVQRYFKSEVNMFLWWKMSA